VKRQSVKSCNYCSGKGGSFTYRFATRAFGILEGLDRFLQQLAVQAPIWVNFNPEFLVGLIHEGFLAVRALLDLPTFDCEVKHGISAILLLNGIKELKIEFLKKIK